MRVAVHYNLPPGGAKRALHAHVRGLLERGHEIELWRPADGDAAEPKLAGLAREHVVPLAHAAPWWEPGRGGGLKSPSRSFAAACEHARLCASEIEAGGFEVCLASTDPIFGSPPLARFIDTCPTVLYLQEPLRGLYEAAPEFPWISSPRGASIARRMLDSVRLFRRAQRARFEVDNAHAFDVILVNSYFSREAVKRIYGIDSHVCYLGVDIDAFRLTDAPREHVVAAVGNLSRHKNAHLLVDAVARMDEPRPRIEWVAAAVDLAYEQEVRKSAAAAHVELVVLKAATDQILLDLLNRARVVVYTPRLEPFGLVPLEAMACGTPVIGIAEGGVRETIIDGFNGLLVDSTGPELTAAIERVVSDPMYSEKLGREGRHLAEARWTLAAATDRLEGHLTGATAHARP
jgi:glycosyltransferase involved in cell wall biosynthesis